MAAADYARGLGADESVAQDVAVAVTEACGNVVLHAYRERDESEEMVVCMENPGNLLCVRILDEGVGMVPRPDSPGLGMGVPLMSRLTSRLEFRSRPEGGTEVCMWFDLAASASETLRRTPDAVTAASSQATARRTA